MDLNMSSTIGEEFYFTPEKKLGLQKVNSDGDMLDLSVSSGGASFYHSLKEGSAISSSLTSPSESESDSEFYVKKMKDEMDKSLLEKVAKYERELEVANKVIRSSQEEICRLNTELAENQTVTEDYESKILDLQNTIIRLEVCLRDSNESNAVLKEMHETNIYEMEHQINSKNDTIRALESELQARMDASANDVSKFNQEIEKLNFALSTANEYLSKERSRFVSEMSVLLEQQKGLQIKLEKAELKAKMLEDHIEQCELEKMEMNKQCELLNKSFDASKLKYDMLMAEKDEFRAKLESLNAQMNSERTQMERMEVRVMELETERLKLLGKVEDGERMGTVLRLKVAKLENEIEMLRDLMFERSEEKREAIRQLCFSLEYYRTEYHQLCKAFGGLRRHPNVVRSS